MPTYVVFIEQNFQMAKTLETFVFFFFFSEKKGQHIMDYYLQINKLYVFCYFYWQIIKLKNNCVKLIIPNKIKCQEINSTT